MFHSDRRRIRSALPTRGRIAAVLSWLAAQSAARQIISRIKLGSCEAYELMLARSDLILRCWSTQSRRLEPPVNALSLLWFRVLFQLRDEAVKQGRIAQCVGVFRTQHALLRRQRLSCHGRSLLILP